MKKTYTLPHALAQSLFLRHERYTLNHLGPDNCRHRVIEREMIHRAAKSKTPLTLEMVGESLEGRSIHLVSFGSGRTKVLLWSQMHGDESTATLALMDIFHFLNCRSAKDQWVDEMLRAVTVYVVPMLNPDGAERRRRRTAVEIDMNRDARALMTPEANILLNIYRRCAPAYGFNLHDQEVSSVGNSEAVTAIALLAPAIDAARSISTVRARAMRVAALLAYALEPFAKGHIAKYDDTYERRAFGDTMQRRGTSTVLIESGHWPGDREKTFIRKLNFVGILTALQAIGTGAFKNVALAHYTKLPVNGKSVYDVLVRDVILEHRSGWRHRVDIGMMLAPRSGRGANRRMITIKDVGDLSTCSGLETIHGRGRRISAGQVPVEKTLPLTAFLSRLHPRRT